MIMLHAASDFPSRSSWSHCVDMSLNPSYIRYDPDAKTIPPMTREVPPERTVVNPPATKNPTFVAAPSHVVKPPTNPAAHPFTPSFRAFSWAYVTVFGFICAR